MGGPCSARGGCRQGPRVRHERSLPPRAQTERLFCREVLGRSHRESERRAGATWVLRRDQQVAHYLRRLGSGSLAMLRDQVNTDISAAMKAKDAARLSALRMLKAAIMNKGVEKGRDLEDSEVLQVVST